MSLYHWLTMQGWPQWEVALRNVAILTLVGVTIRRRRKARKEKTDGAG